MNWYVHVLKQYIAFDGRSGRKEFWWFFVINLGILIFLTAVDNLLGLRAADAGLGGGFFSGLYSLGVLLPGIGVAIRRLHDTGRSGWWLLISLIPIVGFIVLIYFYALESVHAPNEYGPEPDESVEPTHPELPYFG
jgi:uncharacterized membrane protein YhaH (DUF805 family)